MIIGYSRTSTAVQVAGLEAQGRDLLAAGVERLFSEKTSAVGPRRELEAALDFARAGDTFVVTKLDRLARSVADLIRIAEILTQKGVGLRILGIGVDTTTPTGRPMLNVIGSIGQFERRLERQREGIAKAKGEGKYKGRAPTARAKASEIVKLAGEGVKSENIASRLGVASVYRILAASKTGSMLAS